MNLRSAIKHSIWAIALFAGSCFGPRMEAEQLKTAPAYEKRAADIWTVLTGDPKGDAADPSLADGAQLAYQYDREKDFLWFRIFLYGEPNPNAFGANLVFDTTGEAGTKVNWWGANKDYKFDKIVTAWVTRSGDGFKGTIGIGDANGVNQKQLNNLLKDNLQIKVAGDSILIGFKRTDLTDKMQMKVLAAVGSNERWNDDLPNVGSLALDLAADKTKSRLREIDLARNNFQLPGDYPLNNSKPPAIKKVGQGKQALILVPGMYSGRTSFDQLIAANNGRYKFYLVTPPGLYGTPARSGPADNVSFTALTWTRHLEQDILELIRKEKLVKPVIVAESHPASIAATELALNHPDQIGGVVISGTNLLQFFGSPKDPTRKTAASLAERQVLVDEGWGEKWFRHVTPETWLSNDLRATTLSSDAGRGQQAWDAIEAAPLEIKIRYLCEFWASDVTKSFDKLQVPMLALVPGFDPQFLADSANTFSKLAYVDSWKTWVPKNPNLELATIPDSRLLIFEDQPQAASEAVAKFVDHINRALPSEVKKRQAFAR